MHVRSPWKVHSYKRTEGRQISIFNIIDYQVVFTNEDEKKPYLLWKKLNGINWLIFIWAVAKNIRCVGIKQKDLSILSFFIDCSKLNLFLQEEFLSTGC